MLRTYEVSNVDQYEATSDPDVIPAEPDSAFFLSRAIGFEATLYGVPGALQYAQMCDQTAVREDGGWGVSTSSPTRRRSPVRTSRRSGSPMSTRLILQVSPSAPREGIANWLPAPHDGFRLMLRLYGPTPDCLPGRWSPPPIVAVSDAETT
jgi:hypothetical protein